MDSKTKQQMTIKQFAATYFTLLKPGIVFANTLTAMAGYLFASGIAGFDWISFAGVTLGVALTIGSACVLNNYTDRHIDKKMKRTKKRAVVSGIVTERAAILFSIYLGLLGFSMLWLGTNTITLLLGIIAYATYVLIYAIAKRRTPLGTEIGSIAGALPPAAGYTAATGAFDDGALLLFLILVAWQMPHFYAIAMFRRDEYKAAGIPVLPLVAGMVAVKRYVILYIAVFMAACVSLTLTGYASGTFAVVMGTIGAVWLIKALRQYSMLDDVVWARRLFFFSLTVLLVLCAMLAIDSVLP